MTVRAQKNESNGTGDPDKPSPDFTLVDDMRVPQRVDSHASKEQEADVSVADLCRKHGVSDASTAQLGKTNCEHKVRTG